MNIGLYSIISSLISYFTVLDLGFGNTIIIYISRYRVKNKKEEEEKLYGMFIIVYLIIGIIATIIGTIVYMNIHNFFGKTMTNEELEKAKIMFLILIFNLAITFPLSIFGYIITAYEKFIFAKSVNIIRMILMPIIMVPLLILGYKSIAMVIVTTILNIGSLIFNMIYCLKSINIKIKLKFKEFNFRLLKDMFAHSFFIFLATIVDKVNNNVDQFILGSMLNTVSVAIYSVAMQFVNVYYSFSTAISGVMLPKISKMIEEKENDDKISDLFIKIGRIQYILMALVLTGFILYGKQFINIWVGTGYDNSYYIACVLMIPYIIPLIQNTGISILQAKNQHKFRTIVYFIIAIFNVIISIVLVKSIGILGTAIGTALAFIVGHGILMNWYYYKKTKINIPKFWIQILKLFVPVTITYAIGLIINQSMPFNIISLIIQIIVYIIVYTFLIWILGINKEEKKLVYENIINKFKKVKKYNIEK